MARATGNARPKAKQSLGQNFLEDSAVARSIVDALHDPAPEERGRRVVELGPGQGALTRHLIEAFPCMTAIEIDRRMVELLQRELPALECVHGDLLKAARALLGKRGDSQQQEIARLQTRLEKVEKLAEQGEGGERDTAMAMAAKARADLERAGYSA